MILEAKAEMAAGGTVSGTVSGTAGGTVALSPEARIRAREKALMPVYQQVQLCFFVPGFYLCLFGRVGQGVLLLVLLLFCCWYCCTAVVQPSSGCGYST